MQMCLSWASQMSRNCLAKRLPLLALLFTFAASALLPAFSKDDSNLLNLNMKRIVVKCYSDSDIAGKEQIIYRCGQTLGRVEFTRPSKSPASSSECEVERLIVISCPDLWICSMSDGLAEHMLDKDTDSRLRLPIMSIKQREFIELEFGREVEFFKAKKAKQTENQEKEGTQTRSYNFVSGPVQFDLVTRAADDIPLKLTINTPQGKRSFEYKSYEIQPCDSALFKIPTNLKVVEAKNRSSRKHYSKQGIATHEPTAPVAEIKNDTDWQLWQTYYYLFPANPDLIVASLKRAEDSGSLDSIGSIPPIAAFTSRIFAQNPQKISYWVEALGSLSATHKNQVLSSALVWSGVPAAKDLAQTISKSENVILKELGDTPLDPANLETLKITSPSHLDMMWGCFMATGDKRYIQKIISVLAWFDRKSLQLSEILIAGAAEWSLSSNCVQHKLVRQIVEEESKTNPEAKEALLRILKTADSDSE